MNIILSENSPGERVNPVTFFEGQISSQFRRLQAAGVELSNKEIQKIYLSFLEDVRSPIELVIFFQSIRRLLGGIRKRPNSAILDIYENIFREAFDKKCLILTDSQLWKPHFIVVIFHNLRDIPNIPESFWTFFTKIIHENSLSWDGNGIAEILRVSEMYRDTVYGEKLIQAIGMKIFDLDLEKLKFRTVQALVINLEHADVNIPAELNDQWIILQNTDGEKNYKTTYNEKGIVSFLATLGDFDGFYMEQNVFICGYEIDIVLYDTHGKIFAIIESDGEGHSRRIAKNKDIRRDDLLIRRGITDLIIHCRNRSKGLICTTGVAFQ